MDGTSTSPRPGTAPAGHWCACNRLLGRRLFLRVLFIHLWTLHVLQASRVNRRQPLLELLHLSLDEARAGYFTTLWYVWLAKMAAAYLELGLGAAAQLDGDGEQWLVDAELGQLVAVALPALLQPLEAALAHGQQGEGRGQVAPLPLRPESANVEGEKRD